ncbi:MAG: hypothetical protein ACRDQZ_25365 [Mycobacteriales bacterium]
MVSRPRDGPKRALRRVGASSCVASMHLSGCHRGLDDRRRRGIDLGRRPIRLRQLDKEAVAALRNRRIVGRQLGDDRIDVLGQVAEGRTGKRPVWIAAMDPCAELRAKRIGGLAESLQRGLALLRGKRKRRAKTLR